jgi:hypothetical protein
MLLPGGRLYGMHRASCSIKLQGKADYYFWGIKGNVFIFYSRFPFTAVCDSEELRKA